MADTGLCCGSLEEPKALMKMGLSAVIVGHVNFLLGALVHGVVLRHIHIHKQAHTVEYGISNVVAIASGMLGVVAGVLAIVLSKNRKRKSLMWSLFVLSLVAALTAAVSAIGLFTSMVRAIIHGGRSLLAHCHLPDATDYSSITNECPFDPTRIYSTTLILWVPLIVTCVIQLVFCARCFAVCISFLGLPCCLTGKGPGDRGRSVRFGLKHLLNSEVVLLLAILNLQVAIMNLHPGIQRLQEPTTNHREGALHLCNSSTQLLLFGSIFLDSTTVFHPWRANLFASHRE